MNQVIRMPDSILPHRVPYGQLRHGCRKVGGQKKRFNDHIKSTSKNAKSYLTGRRLLHSTELPVPLECHIIDAEYDCAAALADTSNRRHQCNRRHQHAPAPFQRPNSVHQCPLCSRQFNSRIGLHSHSKTLN